MRETLGWPIRTTYAINSGMLDRSSRPLAASQPHAEGDLIGELLHGMRLHGLDYRRIEIAPPFGIAFGHDTGRAHFHFVARGPLLLRLADGATQELATGDALLMPRGGQHELLSDPAVAVRGIASFPSAPLCGTVEAVEACPDGTRRDDDRVIFSGCMAFDLGSMHPLVEMMPEVMRVGTLLDRYPELPPMLAAMAREACERRAGFAGILARLAEVVAASVVRGWVECGCGDATGWVAALRDPRLGRALAAMHREPGRDWTVARLAAEAGTSRSVFAERFLAATGMTPLRYVTELRMRLAAEWIGRDRVPIDVAAERLGYASQAAFSRAYKRLRGQPPGAARTAGPEAAGGNSPGEATRRQATP